MFNPFEAIFVIAEGIVDAIEENEELARKEWQKKDELKRKRKEEQERLYWERWKVATQAERENPDEWRCLPYGWSPFGIFL